MKIPIELKINEEMHELLVEPNRTLLEVLREDLDYTGTKESCDSGECGVCTVLINGKAVLSCLTLAADCRGDDIFTIESLAKGGELHKLQKAFIDHGAVQCGFCTPGMILSAKALLDNNSAPSEEQIKEAIKNVLCRCTGYVKIIKAIHSAAE